MLYAMLYAGPNFQEATSERPLESALTLMSSPAGGPEEHTPVSGSGNRLVARAHVGVVLHALVVRDVSSSNRSSIVHVVWPSPTCQRVIGQT